MIRPPRASRSLRTLAPLLAAASLTLTVASPTASAASGSEGTVTYQKETEQAFQQQLAKSEIQSVTINKRLRTLRITLKDGRHVLARYQPRQENRVAAELRAKGAAVAVLSKSQASKEAKKKTTHHKLRYIAGGILIAVVAVVGIVLVVNRRRQPD